MSSSDSSGILRGMDDGDIGAIAVAILTGAIGTAGGTALQAAARKLKSVIQQRLGNGPGQAELARYNENPHGASEQEGLARAVTVAAHYDSAFAQAIQSIAQGVGSPVSLSMTHVGRDQISSDVRAYRGGIAIGGGVSGRKVSIGNRRTIQVGGGFLALLLLALVVYFGTRDLEDGSGVGNQITKNSTCAEFMRRSPTERDEAVNRVALELGQELDPFSRLNIESICGGSPSRKFGTAVDDGLRG